MTVGPFVDFLVAIVALVLMMMSHKFIRMFLDYLIPFGGGAHGPGSLISGLMEGAGIALGSKMMNAGVSAAKMATGLGASAGIAGLAGARAFLKNNPAKRALPSLKSVASASGMGANMWGASTSPMAGAGLASPDTTPLGLDTPESQSWTMKDPFSKDSTTGPGGAGFSFASATASGPSAQQEPPHQGQAGGSSTTTSTTMGTGTSRSGSMGATMAGPLFDNASTMSGAHTRLMPSSREKLATLEDRPAYKSARQAFVGEARRRLQQDIGHKAMGSRGIMPGRGYAGASSLVGVAMQEFGAQSQDSKIFADSHLPSPELIRAAQEGGTESEAAGDVARIGQYQQSIERGLDMMSQGDVIQQDLGTDYQTARTNYQLADDEVNVISAQMDVLRGTPEENSTQFAMIQSAHAQSIQRRDALKMQYEPLEARMQRAKNLSQRGERMVVDAQNSIGKINWKYYKNPSQSMMQSAQARATRVGLNDLNGPSSRGRRT